MVLKLFKAINGLFYQYFLNPVFVIVLALITLMFLSFHFVVWFFRNDKNENAHIKISN